MARGYIIGNISVSDPEGFQHYIDAATKAIQHHRAKLLARGGRCEILEGDGTMRNVILEFPSYEAAHAYYYSPEYQAAMKCRAGNAVANIIVVEGV